jgi:hypothetical protein
VFEQGDIVGGHQDDFGIRISVEVAESVEAIGESLIVPVDGAVRTIGRVASHQLRVAEHIQIGYQRQGTGAERRIDAGALRPYPAEGAIVVENGGADDDFRGAVLVQVGNDGCTRPDVPPGWRCAI